MAAGNASNTVFTAIPVGEDFYMSFSTERFHAAINPQDFISLNFKLYDARVIGDIGSPNPNALIREYNNQPNTDYSDNDNFSNPNGRPLFFKISPKSIAVLVSSDDLDNYEKTKTGNNAAVFRGELYGFVEATVGGDETNVARLVPAAIQPRLQTTATLLNSLPPSFFWDGYFFREDIRSVRLVLNVNSPALGASNIGSP
jgi:hypothetical protein